MKQVRKMVTLLLAALLLFGIFPNVMAAENVVLSEWTGGNPTKVEDDVPYEGYTGNVIEKAETVKLTFSYAPRFSVETDATYFCKFWYKGNPEFVYAFYGIVDGVDGQYIGEAKVVPGNSDGWTNYSFNFIADNDFLAKKPQGEVTSVHLGVRNRFETATCRISDIMVEQRIVDEITTWTLSANTSKDVEEGTITCNYNNTTSKNEVIANQKINFVPGKMYKLTFDYTSDNSEGFYTVRYLYPMVRTLFSTADYTISLQTDYKVNYGIDYSENYSTNAWLKFNNYDYETLKYPTASNPWVTTTIYFIAPNVAYETAQVQFIRPTTEALEGTVTIKNVVITEDTSGVKLFANGNELEENQIISGGEINAKYHYVPSEILALGENPEVSFIAAVYKVNGSEKKLCSVDVVSDKTYIENTFTKNGATAFLKLTRPQDIDLNLAVPELESGNYEIKVMAWEDFPGMSPNCRPFVHTATFTAE